MHFEDLLCNGVHFEDLQCNGTHNNDLQCIKRNNKDVQCNRVHYKIYHALGLLGCILKIYNAAQSIIIHSAYSAPNSSYPLAYATPFLLNDMTFPLSLPLCHSWCSIIYCSAARLAGQGQGLLTACHAEAFPNSSRGSKALVPRPAFSQIHPFNFYNPWNSLLNFDWKKFLR